MIETLDAIIFNTVVGAVMIAIAYSIMNDK